MLAFLRWRLGLTFRIRKTPNLPPLPVTRNDPGMPSLPQPEFTPVSVPPPE
jgi:hypothetical protein